MPSNNQALPSSSAVIETTNHENVNNADNVEQVIFRGGNQSLDEPINSTNAILDNTQLVNDDEQPIAQPIIPIHSKTKNWYSNYCNRWVSLFGAILKIVIMMLVNTYYGATCIVVVFLVWFYVGTANPAVKPGLAAEFRLIVWLKGLVNRCIGYDSFIDCKEHYVYIVFSYFFFLLRYRKRNTEYEQIVVTPSCPGVNLRSDQLNEENEDFSSRRRYHQTSIIQGHYVDDV